MKTETIGGYLFLQMVMLGASQLGRNRNLVNDLNVFPIPDGDTGDNMYMTIKSGCDSATGDNNSNLSDISQKVSSGMLMGARGNSGVIFSRIFAGLSKGLSGLGEADLEQWKQAMESAVEEAYGAVAEPVEGTMLTVLRESVEAARAASDIEDYFRLLCDESDASLERTPSLLDVLARAGVVDSGGSGLTFVFRGMQAALSGETAEEIRDLNGESGSRKVDLDSFTEDSVLEFGYCTEFLLRLQSSKVDIGSFDESVIRDYLEGAGESLVFFREGSIIKVHLHTMHPGDILNACQKWGEYLTVKIENMTLQHHENHMDRIAPSKGPRRACSVVTVANGDGLVKLFSDMGAEVIAGGQTMNPSTEDFIRAFDTVNANRIFVLPNNSNIIMTAVQAASIYDKSEVTVLPSRTLGEGYCVLGSVDFAGGSSEEVKSAAEAVISSVVTGMVSRAIRTTDRASEGDYIGFAGKEEILSASPERNKAVTELCGKLSASDYDVILLVRGADVPEEESAELCKNLQEMCRHTEIVQVDGGQPVYDYILIFE